MRRSSNQTSPATWKTPLEVLGPRSSRAPVAAEQPLIEAGARDELGRVTIFVFSWRGTAK